MQKLPMGGVKANRIEYIDALRGFTMLLVVMAHVCTFCFDTDSAILNYFSVFRMPLFFTISGFVLYKPEMVFDSVNLSSFLKKKFRVQIIPTLVFFCLYEWLLDHDFIGGIFHGAKHGYWFTLALFYYFVFYALIKYICFRIKLSVVENAILIVAGLGLYVFPKFLHVVFGFNSATGDLFSISELCYFIFFVSGILIKKYYKSFTSCLNTSELITLVIFINLIGYLIYSMLQIPDAMKFIFHFILRISGVVMAIAFFYKYEQSFSSTNRIGNIFQFIGKRTLDIYLLHYFILPRNMQGIVNSLDISSMPFLYFFFVFLIAALVISFCLGISCILRTSPTLGHWLFGARK